MLIHEFDKVTVLPQNSGGGKVDLPGAVVLDEALCSINNNKLSRMLTIMYAFISPVFYREILINHKKLSSFHNLSKLVYYSGTAIRIYRKLRKLLNNAGTNNVVLYTYWFSAATIGIGLLKKLMPSVRIVSRAHSCDIYEEYFSKGYMPCREQSAAYLDLLLPDSSAGVDYLIDRYPKLAGICEVGLLGVADPGYSSKSSTDGVFRIATCSFLIPRKRVNLILEALIQVQKINSEIKIEWTHIGDGPMQEELLKKALEITSTNIKINFKGYLAPDKLMNYYKNEPVDMFANVSEYEGTPVSLMEAASCGIPVMATNIGGNAELIDYGKAGILLAANPAITEIAAEIINAARHKDDLETKRINIKRVWIEKYNSEINFVSFAQRIRALPGNLPAERVP